MMEKILKRTLPAMLVLAAAVLAALWGIRVYHVNSGYGVTEENYGAGDSFTYGDWSVEVEEGLLMKGGDFRKAYAAGLSGDFDGYMVGLKVNVESLAQELPALDDIVMAFASTGFRTATWFNGMDPYLFQDMNEEGISSLCETGKGELVLATNVSSASMSRKHYRDIMSQDFYYVFSQYPENIRVHVTP